MMQFQDSRLVRLPREVLDNITSSLPTQDFNALRFACKELEAKIYPYWANCFFKKKQFMIEQFSLQSLVDISHHNALSKVMTHLIIGLDNLEACGSRLLPDVAEFLRWRSAACAQRDLFYTGGAVNLLSEALDNLPNLKSVEVRDFNSPTRYRDAVQGEYPPSWRSYGSSRYWPPPGNDGLIPANPATDLPEKVFRIILAVLGRCSSKVRSLGFVLRNQQSGGMLRDDAFGFFPAPDDGLVHALLGLTELHLDVCSRSVPAHMQNIARLNRASSQVFADPNTAYLRRFLTFTPNITWLRLNFSGSVHGELSQSPSKFLTWLGLKSGSSTPSRSPWERKNPAPISLPLRRLDLGNASTSLGVLSKLLDKFRDLECICIRKLTLEPQPGPNENTTDKNDDCLWASLIRNLHTAHPKLKRLELGTLYELSPQSEGMCRIIFHNKADPIHSPAFMSIRVIDHKSLELLADRTWPETRLMREVCSCDEDDSMGDDNDDEEDQEEEPAEDEA